MGRYVYDQNLVRQALDELNRAVASLNDINTELQSGINMIKNATGASFIDVDYTKLLELQPLAEEALEEDVRTINSKMEAIEDYENAPWYTKLFSSVGMALGKFVEGVFSTVEDLGDGVASVVGFVGGIFNSEFKNSVGEWIQKDHVGDFFAEQYENGFLEGVEKYSLYSHTSTMANIFKGVGCAAPYIALSMTGVGLVTETIAAGVGGLGSGTEAGLQKTASEIAQLEASLEEQVKNGIITEEEAAAALAQAKSSSYNKAFASGLWQGTKNAALVYAMGSLSNKVRANAANKTGSLVSGSTDDFIKLSGSNADDVATTAKKIFGCSDDLVANAVKDSAGNITGYSLIDDAIGSSSYGQVVGDVLLDGQNVIVRSFGNAGTTTATRVLASSGDEILFNTIKNTNELAGKGFSELVKTNVATGVDDVFTNAAKFKDTKAGQLLDKADDAIVNSKVGQVVQNTAKKAAGSKLGTLVKNTAGKLADTKLGTALTTAVSKHPAAAFGVTATAFTLDQIDEQQVGAQYRIEQAQLEAATAKEVAPLPTPPTNPGTTPSVTPTTPGTTPSVTPTTPGTTPSVTPTTPGTTPSVTPTTPETTPAVTPTTPETEPYIPETPNPSQPDEGDQPSGGGGYNGGGYTGEENITDPNLEDITDSELDMEDLGGSIIESIGGDDYVNIPSSSTPISTTTTTGGKKSIIPVIAGLGAAAVAGIGTKAYLDKKEEEKSSEEQFETEEWNEDTSLDLGYEDAPTSEDNDYLDPSDEYAYQEEPMENYEAVNSSELASMQ